jgi:hypothetical protein
MHDPLVVAWEIRSPIPRRWSHSRRWHFPLLVTIWHREPGGHDSGEVCKPYRRVFDEADRTWKLRAVHGWRLHFWHWKIQVHPAQAFRRWLLTRCAWCGGRQAKSDPVNIRHSWDGEKSRWWQGERGLFHHDCSSVERAGDLCLCTVPVIRMAVRYGTCEGCGKFRPYGHAPDEADRLLASLPHGSRITPELRPRIDALWAERRDRKQAQEAAGE